MKMGRSIYTVERSKAVLWMYLSNIYIYMYSSLRFFIYISLSYLQHCFIRRIKLPRIFLHSNCFFPFRAKFLLSFPSSLESAYFYFRTSTRVTFESRIRSFSTRRKVSFAIYWNFSLALEEIFTKDGNIIKEKLSMHEIRWKRYEIEFQQLSYWDFFFFLNDYSWTCLVASDIQMRSETGREYYSISFFLSNVSFVNSIFS